MIIKKELVQFLNLVHLTPGFVIHETDQTSTGSEFINVQTIPNNDGIYWVPGKVIFKNLDEHDAVFVVDTNSGGSFLEVFLYLDKKWWDLIHRDPHLFDVLHVDKDDVFPFDWTFSIPLEYDMYHDDPPSTGGFKEWNKSIQS